MSPLPPSSLPSSIDAEIALLGAVLVNNDAFDPVSRIVSVDDFEDGIHQRIWELIRERRGEGRIANPVTLRAVLGDAPIGEITIGQYLARLAADATTVVNAPDYALIVRDAAHRRRVLGITSDLNELTMSGVKISDVTTEGIARLDAIALAAAPTFTPRVTVGQAAEKALTEMHAAIARGGRISGITTGLREMDGVLNGFQKGELVTGAARPSMGKSALASAIAINAAQAGHGTYFVSLEMTDEQIGQRVLADLVYDSHDPIPYNDLRRGRVSESQIHRLERAKDKLDSLPLEIEQEPGLTVSQIAARARKVRAEFERRGKTLDLLLVDHLHIVKPAKTRHSKHEEITETTEDLKALAKNLDVAVLCFCQLNRGTEGRDDKRPTLADLRGSGSIEENSGVVFFIYRHAYYLERQRFPAGDPREQERIDALTECQATMEVIIAKQRQGPLKTVDLFCSIGCNVVRDLYR